MISTPASVITIAKSSPSTGCRRCAGNGRVRVRRISASVSRSITWLNAEAPPATSPVPSSSPADAKQAERLAIAHRVAGKRRGHHEHVESRLGQREVVARAGLGLRQRSRVAASRLDRPMFRFSAAWPRSASGVRIGCTDRSKPARKVRSVSTSDVPSTAAPLTTCAVLMSGFLPLQITKAPSVTCTKTRPTSRTAGRTRSRRRG